MFKKIIRAIAKSQERRATRQLLLSFSKKELDDIGINRCDIPQIVSEIK